MIDTSNPWLVVSAIAVVVLIFVLTKLFSSSSGKTARNPYQKFTALFSPDERVFYLALKEAVSAEYEVFGKIRAADLIVAKKSLSGQEMRLAPDPIGGRHFDFVLCDKKSLSAACVIQLHDKTDPEQRAQREYDPLGPICENIGLPFALFHVKASYAPEEIREKLRKAMSREPFYLIETDGRKEPRISSLDDVKF